MMLNKISYLQFRKLVVIYFLNDPHLFTVGLQVFGHTASVGIGTLKIEVDKVHNYW